MKNSGITDAYIYNAFKESQKQFDGDLVYDNFFDRKYFPSGMWSIMDDAMDLMFYGDADENVAAAADMIQTNYQDLL